MELKIVIVLLMYIPFVDFFDFIEIPICSLYITIPEPSTVFKAWSWSTKSSPYRSSSNFMSCSSESILGRRKRDAKLRCLSSVRNNTPPPNSLYLIQKPWQRKPQTPRPSGHGRKLSSILFPQCAVWRDSCAGTLIQTGRS